MSRRGRFLAFLLVLLSYQGGCARCRRASPEGSLTPADTLVVGISNTIENLDPRFVASAVERQVTPLVHCSLFQTDADGTMMPYLAMGAPESLDGATLSVTLRSGVSFSDGTPLTAKDVKATYDGILAQDKSRLPLLDRVETPRPDRVLFHLTKRDGTFAQHLTAGILPATATSKSPPSPVSTCGPYTLTARDADGFLLEANSQYDLGEPARTKRIRFVVVRDEEKRLTRLRRGRLDLVPEITERALIKEVTTKHPSLLTQRRAALATTYLVLNERDPALGNRMVRRAIAHALDRRPVIDYVFGGFATPARLALGIQHDPARAVQLLNEAGFKQNDDKARLDLTLRTTPDVMRIREAKALATQLEKVGIQISVETGDEASGRSKERPQLLLASFPETNAAPMATADLTLIGLWRQDVIAVHDRRLKGFVLHADGSLASLSAAQKTQDR